MATKIVTKNSSTASAVPTASDLVQGELAVNVADKRLFTEDNAGAIVELGTNPSGNVTFQDNGKAIFGAGSDLQIYHDGSNSYVKDAGTGNLRIGADNLVLENSAATETFLYGVSGGSIYLSYANSAKLATTSTGIDVTGTVTADALTSQGTLGSWAINTEGVIQTFSRPSTSYIRATNASGSLAFDTGGSNRRLFLANNGDISFYEDTGTTAKFFWDASAESLGIGTTTPSNDFHVSSTSGTKALFEKTGSTGAYIGLKDSSGSLVYLGDNNGTFEVQTAGSSYSTKLAVTSAGNVGIGNDSPTQLLTIGDTSDSASRIQFFSSATGANTIHFGDGASADAYVGYINYDHSSNSLQFAAGGAERLRIDSSGNLLVGGTSAFGADTITLGTGGFAGIRNTGGSCLELRRDSSDGSILDFQKDGTTVGSIGYGGGAILYNAASNYGLKFYDAGGANIIHPATTAGGDKDSSIDLGYSGARFKDLYLSGSVSTNTATGLSITANSSNRGILNLSTSTAYQLIGGAYYGYTGYKTGGYHRFFGSDGSEDMRIDSSGNLALGDSNAYTHRLFVKGVGANEAVGLAVGTNNTNIIRFYNSGLGTAGAIKVNSGGTTVTYNTSSDQRLKENIADADDAGSKIDAIQVRQYDWKADGSHQDYGMIAQELQAVAPEAVSGDADSEEMMGVDYSKLVPMLIKEIQSLRNRVAQLEG